MVADNEVTTSELKERCDEALHAAANHFGDSAHWTRFMLPAVQEYIARLEFFAPASSVASTERPAAMTVDELILFGETVATPAAEVDSAPVVDEGEAPPVVDETPDGSSKPKGKLK